MSELIDKLINRLEGDLNLAPGALPGSAPQSNRDTDEAKAKAKTKLEAKERKKAAGVAKAKAQSKKAVVVEFDPELPAICHIEFKVGVITKVWKHPEADKLWCEEIDCGEEAVRQISSGLVPHYNEAGMLGRRLLVVANLKAKNLKGFKSHGMVLCAASANEDGSEKVQFVEPPVGAPLGEVIQYEGLPPTKPQSAAQVLKKKLFEAAVPDLATNEKYEGTWKGHVFMTTAGPCKCIDIALGAMR